MGVNEYAKELVDDFIMDITDHLFLSIENDDQKMREYMTNVNRFGKDTVNMAIGKKITVALNLDNADKNLAPRSRLITEYTRHKLL